jgi:hypothetical protein
VADSCAELVGNMDEMWRRQMRDDRLRSLHLSPTKDADSKPANPDLTIEDKGTLRRVKIQAAL